MVIVDGMWLRIQRGLFSFVGSGITGELTDKIKQLVCILELLPIEHFTTPAWMQWMGRNLIRNLRGSPHAVPNVSTSCIIRAGGMIAVWPRTKWTNIEPESGRNPRVSHEYV